MSGNTPAARAIAQIDSLYDARTAPQTDIKAIARKTRVPVNVLLALDDGQGDLKAIEATAGKIAQAMEGGAPIEDAIIAATGDEARGRAILETAYDLADQMEPPAPAAADSRNDGHVGIAEGVAGIARDFGSGMLRAGGGALEAAGVVADEAVRGAFSDDPSQATFLRGAGRAAGDVARGAGEGIAAGRSEDS